jgi:hypothetical protein
MYKLSAIYLTSTSTLLKIAYICMAAPHVRTNYDLELETIRNIRKFGQQAWKPSCTNPSRYAVYTHTHTLPTDVKHQLRMPLPLAYDTHPSCEHAPSDTTTWLAITRVTIYGYVPQSKMLRCKSKNRTEWLLAGLAKETAVAQSWQFRGLRLRKSNILSWMFLLWGVCGRRVFIYNTTFNLGIQS